jgi:3-deoxy-manno-octulosonate cytidylyltransferase (CMP-KDO synthetase)
MGSSPSFIAMIPARFASSRFPGKMMQEIQGKTLIQLTWENASRYEGFSEVIVATDDKRIFEHCQDIGARVVMTDEDCPNGTQRIAQGLQRLDNIDADYIINVQGDEPCVSMQTFDALIETCKQNANIKLVTPVTPIVDQDEIEDPSCVKCVFDNNFKALYFSRQTIPYHQHPSKTPAPCYYKHLGIYCFRKDFLETYCALSAQPLQTHEDLEQLKVLEHGYDIHVAVVKEASIGVDTKDDLNKLERFLCKQNTSS